jgi:glutamate racemase
MTESPTQAISPRPAPDQTTSHGPRIGVFDSGLGGLSVLKALRQHLPTAELLYVADSGHAPYGERDDGFIAERSLAITRFLLDQGAQAMVVACNTATAAAVHSLRAQWPDLPIVGVEPGIKPAVAASHNKRVGVLATPATLSSAKFKHLMTQHGQGAELFLQPCPGLAKEIEKGQLDTPTLRALVQSFSEPLLQSGADTVVLGCTHYPFVAPLFQEALGPGVRIVDTADAVARHTARMVNQLLLSAPHAPDAPGRTLLWSSADPEHLRLVARQWLGLDVTTGALL